MELILKFITLLKSQVGKGIYVWGGDGESLTAMKDAESWIEKHETSADNSNRAVTLYRKRVSKGIEPILAFDCSGLIYWALKQCGVLKGDINSRGLYAKCKPIAKGELRRGDLVFRWSDKDDDGFDVSEIYHVGAMITDTDIVECQGRDVGVVQTKLNSRWGAFGRLSAFEDSVNAQEPKEPVLTDKQLEGYVFKHELSKGDSGEAVRALQYRLIKASYALPKYGIDGEFGSETQAAVKSFQAKIMPTGVANRLVLTELGAEWEA